MSDKPVRQEPPVAVSSEDIQAQPHRTGHSRIDLIIAVTAILLSVISLFVAVQNAETQREMVSASTWPFVSGWIKIGGNEQRDVSFGVSNAGVGPAKLRSFEVIYKDTPVVSVRDLLRRCCGLTADKKAADAALVPWTASTVVQQIVLRSGEEQLVFVLRPDPKAPELAARFAKALNDVRFRGCYCSVLDECWASDLNSTEARRVKSCPVPQHPFVADGP